MHKLARSAIRIRDELRTAAPGSLDGGELDGVRKDAPDRLAGGGDRRGERWIGILKQRDHLEHEQVESVTQLGERALRLALVVRAKRVEQVVDLILERELRVDADRVRFLQASLQ